MRKALKRREKAKANGQFLQRLINRLRWLGDLPVPLRYAIATLMVIVTFIIRYALGDFYPGPFLLFIPTVIAVSLLFNRKTGVYACLLSAAFAVYFFLKPFHSLSVYTFTQVITILIFTLVGLFTAYVIEALRGMIVSLEEKNKEVLAAEKALYQAQKMEAVGQAVSIMAHDFRNVLTPILGGVDLLKRYMPPDEKSQEVLEILENACDGGKKLVDDILLFARKEAKDFAFYDLNALIERDAGILRQGVKAEISLQFDLADGLPQVFIEPELLSRTLGNLVRNAADAMPEGGKIEIQTLRSSFGPEGREEVGKYVCLSVRDTGTGIAPELKEKIFEPFFTTKPAGAGTGLGLAMVADFVQRAQGHLSVDSEPGNGTTIKVFFPVRR